MFYLLKQGPSFAIVRMLDVGVYRLGGIEVPLSEALELLPISTLVYREELIDFDPGTIVEGEFTRGMTILPGSRPVHQTAKTEGMIFFLIL